MLLVGLTGGIACGKSTVSRRFQEGGGVAVVDADKVYRDLSRHGCWAWGRVVRAFGQQVLREDGELDRAWLGQKVFGDAAARKRLNEAVRVPIWGTLFAHVVWHWFACERVVVMDVPLLFESKMDRFIKYNVVVWVPPHVQLERLMARDGSTEEAAQSRIQAQMPTDEKKKRADILIDNTIAQEDLPERVDELASQLLSSRSDLQWAMRTPYGVAIGIVVCWYFLRYSYERFCI